MIVVNKFLDLLKATFVAFNLDRSRRFWCGGYFVDTYRNRFMGEPVKQRKKQPLKGPPVKLKQLINDSMRHRHPRLFFTVPNACV